MADPAPIIVTWQQMPELIAGLYSKTAAIAACVQQSLRGIYLEHPAGVWYHPQQRKLGFEWHFDCYPGDADLCKTAVEGLASFSDEIPSFAAGWIKLAVSPLIHRALQLGNFMPGTYPGGIPNHPGPVAGMLTSGLVGAGLGYGAGTLLEGALPGHWERGRLRKTLAMMGAAPGMSLGALWGLSNMGQGLKFNDNSLSQPISPVDTVNKAAAAFDLGKIAAEEADSFDTYNRADAVPTVPAIDSQRLNQLLWDKGDQQIAGTTQAVLVAAGRMPGGLGDPRWVTPMQMGELAARMGAGWLSGALVGKALGLMTGMPESTQNTLAQAGMITAVARTLLPHLF